MSIQGPVTGPGGPQSTFPLASRTRQGWGDEGHTPLPSPSQLGPQLEITSLKDPGLSLRKWGFLGIKGGLWETQARDSDREI